MDIEAPPLSVRPSNLPRPFEKGRPSQSLDTSSISLREKVNVGDSLPVRPNTTQPESFDTIIEDAGGLADRRIVRPIGDLLSSLPSSKPQVPECEAHALQDEGYVTDSGVKEQMEEPQNDPQLAEPLRRKSHFLDLPGEILRAILDDIFGSVSSISASALAGRSGLRSINSLMRHPRRKTLSDIALVCPALRDLIQERIYRQIKIKGTDQGIDECDDWFLEHSHLTKHVRHIEYWVPVWGNKTLMPPLPSSLLQTNDHDVFGNPTMLMRATADRLDDGASTSFTFERATQNATLSDIFDQVNTLFPDARILTLEGGHCKKPPMISHFRPGEDMSTLVRLRNIRTLVMRGTWNIMRQINDWKNIQYALPNVQEWHCAYAKHKPEAYPMIGKILSSMSYNMLHVNLSLEGFYSKNEAPGSWTDGTPPPHLCQLLGLIAPRFESLTFSGRFCSCFFAAMRGALAAGQQSRLRSLDLVLKSCCSPLLTLGTAHTDPSTLPSMMSGTEIAGISNMAFIHAFERCVLGAVRSLGPMPQLEYIRIRFIDLDSACPLLNPYFQLLKGKCTGLWTDEIIELLAKMRSGVEYEELTDGITAQWSKNDVIIGAVYPRTRPKAINSGAYRILASTR